MHTRLPIYSPQNPNASTNRLTCTICPHLCELNPGEIGRCHVRHHSGVSIVPSMYGQCSILAVEPIEKRPLFHFDPGEKYLAVGFYGCSFCCDFCQNFSVSQTTTGNSKKLLPTELIALAKEKSTRGIAFTFNEPTIYYEYLMDVATADPDVPLVVKTNGFVTSETLYDLCYVIDAFNVDIKGDDEEYQKVCGGSLKPVLDCVDEIYAREVHVEISYLVTPRLLHNVAYHDHILSWLKEMPDIPVHFLYFYPFHRMTDQSYGVHDFLPLVEKFKEQLKYVYVSNLYTDAVLKYRNTYCPGCASLMVQRNRSIEVIKTECCDTVHPFKSRNQDMFS